MADAAQLGVKIFEDKIVVKPETAIICRFFEIDPLQLISSGALLIAVEEDNTSETIQNLTRGNIPATEIGLFEEDTRSRTLVKEDGSFRNLPRPISDHLWVALKKATTIDVEIDLKDFHNP
jgi:hydrogenase maturation factor